MSVKNYDSKNIDAKNQNAKNHDAKSVDAKNVDAKNVDAKHYASKNYEYISSSKKCVSNSTKHLIPNRSNSSLSLRNGSKSASSGNSPISIPSPANRAKSAHLLRTKSKGSERGYGLKVKETASISSLQNLLQDMKMAIDDTKQQLVKNEKSISKISK